ncbi:MAG: MurR/RpiR family transcriptional regulator [Candidatus Symbiobacter sp.]|nr:MurR/RpiR family transcriptional regulator [Candidatus Symbiobacter sp.]
MPPPAAPQAKLQDIIAVLTRLARQHQAGEGDALDQRIAATILENAEFAATAPMAALAERAQVSEATITRFCRHLGCESSRDFKYRLTQALAVGRAYLQPTPPPRHQDQSEIAHIVAAGAVAAITATRDSVDGAKLQQVAELIAAAQQIFCFGSGGTSSMAAVELQNRLFRLGLASVAQIDGQLQVLNAAVSRPGTVVVGFSRSGYARSVIDALGLARHYGGKTVAITALGSELAATADLVINLDVEEDGNIYKPSPSRYALLAVIDMIATLVAEIRGSEALENLRRIKQSLNRMNVFDPKLPLGD